MQNPAAMVQRRTPDLADALERNPVILLDQALESAPVGLAEGWFRNGLATDAAGAAAGMLR